MTPTVSCCVTAIDVACLGSTNFAAISTPLTKSSKKKKQKKHSAPKPQLKPQPVPPVKTEKIKKCGQPQKQLAIAAVEPQALTLGGDIRDMAAGTSAEDAGEEDTNGKQKWKWPV
jgi:hypothetical protein